MVLVTFSVNSARSEFETLVKNGEKEIVNDPASVMAKGRIKLILKARGFGMIEQEAGKDIMFFIKDLLRTNPEYKNKVEELEGLGVVFDVADGRKGPLAVNLKLMY